MVDKWAIRKMKICDSPIFFEEFIIMIYSKFLSYYSIYIWFGGLFWIYL